MCNAITNKCKTCHLREVTEVTGDDADIRREFDRIEACQHKRWDFKHEADAQTKTPSADTDGV